MENMWFNGITIYGKRLHMDNVCGLIALQSIGNVCD